ncbi:hypothetical protein KBTX_01924 [wastewater metagenome]|uniref:Biopolymer transport protein ExbD n=2 Tax=unclassified sequences TaxID=12908 RepID=A0A5B8RAH4_9ZZZZ|nr:MULTISPECIES: biopolymer transporter ExbD [Arhodomonas]MCS4503310.1 biopolymer transporter ExbD [Arhodomonas aquaeolei]QEA05601.1 hypothetical protein KBTEX_01924 [uncultured organism]
MNLSPRRRDEPEINLTPLIDVVFLMLIFFMVSTTFVQQTRLDVTLPSAEQSATTPERETLHVTISPDGRISVDGRTLANGKVATIRQALEDALGDRDAADVPVVVDADANARHQVVVRALDAAGQAGLTHVGMAAAAGAQP